MDLRKAQSVFDGHVCVAGNVSPTGAFLSGSPEEVIADTEVCIEAWGDNGGYILTLGCDFPRTVPLENIKALMSFKGKKKFFNKIFVDNKTKIDNKNSDIK